MEIRTEAGEIEIEVDTAKAPIIEVIQAGIDSARAGESLPPIPLEGTSVTGIRHEDVFIQRRTPG